MNFSIYLPWICNGFGNMMTTKKENMSFYILKICFFIHNIFAKQKIPAHHRKSPQNYFFFFFVCHPLSLSLWLSKRLRLYHKSVTPSNLTRDNIFPFSERLSVQKYTEKRSNRLSIVTVIAWRLPETFCVIFVNFYREFMFSRDKTHPGY